ncbi:MAG: glycosyltransferase family 4 protein [Chloroflexota bacterium]|nr:glycosyltransferase family 4 protein [Dehalococcoidia bacterium]MDW8253566.1 glycosyltransferase family 4 protein [Chloroflexota bacterium]
MSARPLRVLMLSKACYVAAYRTKLEAMASLPEVEVTLAVPPYWQFGRRREPLEPGNDRNYRLIVLSPLLNGNHHLHFYPGIGRLLDETQPDLFHIDEEPYDVVTVHALWAARRRGIPALFFTWQNLDRRYPPPFEWFRRWTLAHAAGAIAGNAEAAAILRRRGYRGPLTVLPQFGVDPDLFPFRPPRDAVPVRIGYVGRLWRGKGVDLLIEAAAGLRGDWQLDLLGAGDEAPALRALIDRLGVRERVRLLGSWPSHQVPAFYRTLDLLVLPSRTLPNWKEQFGRVLIEAMASGVAVVGSNSGEIPNVIGDAGWIVPEGDVAALRAQLQAVIDSPALRAAAAERGRRRVLDRFTQQRIATATVAFYRSILGQTPGCSDAAPALNPA